MRFASIAKWFYDEFSQWNITNYELLHVRENFELHLERRVI